MELAVVDVEHETTAGSEDTANILQHIAIRHCVEVAKALPHADDGIAAGIRKRERAHVSAYEIGVAATRCGAPRHVQCSRVAIDPGDAVPGFTERHEMTARSAAEIHNGLKCRHRQLTGEERYFAFDDAGVDASKKR
jgi:hypothetical protein